MTPMEVLQASSVVGLFSWLVAELINWLFCVSANNLAVRRAMKASLIVIYLRLTAATWGDMPLDYTGAAAYAIGAAIGVVVVAHHLRRVFRYGDRCRRYESKK